MICTLKRRNLKRHEQFKECIEECLACLTECNHCYDACLKQEGVTPAKGRLTTLRDLDTKNSRFSPR
jgi:hypothetical protein